MELNDFLNKIIATKELTLYDKAYKVENCCIATDGDVLRAAVQLGTIENANISIFIKITNKGAK